VAAATISALALLGVRGDADDKLGDLRRELRHYPEDDLPVCLTRSGFGTTGSGEGNNDNMFRLQQCMSYVSIRLSPMD
jgi:hypothetical protein